MGCGFDDADTDFIAEEELPNALSCNSILDPWVMPAPSSSSQSTSPEKPTSEICSYTGGSTLAFEAKRRRMSKKTASPVSDHATSAVKCG